MTWADHFSDKEFVENLKHIAEAIYNVDGDEAVNETYLRCLKLSETKKRINKRFIRGVLYNFCRDTIKAQGKESDIFQHIRTHELIEAEDMEEEATDLIKYAKMDILLNKVLSEEIDSDLLMRALTGENLQELAVESGVSYDALRKRVSRFRIYLNEKYGNTMYSRLKGIKDDEV